jgi:sodium/hydrogen exchanger 10/11
MVNKILGTLFVVLVFFSYINCQKDKKDNDDTRFYPNQLLFVYTGLVLVVFIRHAVVTFDICVPHAIFCITAGLLCGIAMDHIEWVDQIGDMVRQTVHHIQYIFLPMILYSTSFCIDAHAFIKALPQIFIISIPVSILSMAATGLLMKEIIDSTWSYVEAMLFGIMFSSIYPLDVLRWLKESTIQTKYVITLLNGETVVSGALSFYIFRVIQHHYEKWVVRWYQFLTGFVRQLFMGVPLSCIFAYFGAFMMRYAYNDPINLMVLTISMCYTTYFLGNWMCNAGLIANVITGIKMGMERTSLSKEVEQGIIYFWQMVTTLMNGILFILIGILATAFISHDLGIEDVILVFVTYLITNLFRFLGFFVHSPILSRVGYGMSFQNMVICVWGGLKNPVNLNMATMISLMFREEGKDKRKESTFFLHAVGVYILMLLINGSFVPILLKALGLTKISLSREINMNNCMKYIYEARAREIAILKMDRFLSDANWPLVLNTTTLKHPYKNMNTVNEDESDEEEEYFLGYRSTYCPDCKKNVPNQPTAKEIKEMNKEAKLRVLKLRKIAYSRQFENGMISKEGIRIMHQAVEIAMDSDSLIIELDGLFKMFKKENCLYRCMRDQIQHLAKSKDGHFKLPRKTWRLWCYRIVNHFIFSTFIYCMVLLNMIEVVCHFGSVADSSFLIVNGNSFFFLVYLAEFWLKVFSYSWIYVCKHGMQTYFASFWNILEFVILCSSFVNVMAHYVFSILAPTFKKHYFDVVLNLLLALRICKLCTYWKCCRFCKKVPNAALGYLNTKVNEHKSLAFELGKSYIYGEEEILDNLNKIVDNGPIRDSIRGTIENDRLSLTRCMGMEQMQAQWVATTVKTKSAIRMVLNSMKDDIVELKVAGWIDTVEYNKLSKSLAERYKHSNSIKSIEPPAPKLIFREVTYLGDDEKIINYLYDNIATKKFDPGDIVFAEGEVVDGIYILITGMFLVTYTPKDEVKEKLKEIGSLPVVDYICSSTYEETMYEYIVAGDTIGELATLTDRPYNGVIMAETYSQVFILSRKTIKNALNMDVDPINGLECRIWKYIGFKKALTILMDVPSYRSYTEDKIKFVLERSFVPDLSNYKVFVVNEMMEDIILLEGVIVDFNTRDVYTGPCYIPRCVKVVILIY